MQFNVKKGDELEVEEQGNKILISAKEESSKLSTVEVDIDGLDKDSLIFLLRGLYIKGYDQIRFTFSDPYLFHYRLNKKATISSVIYKEMSTCPGLDVIQERNNFILMKNITVSSIKEFDTLLRRIFLLLIEVAHDFHFA